MNRQFPILDGPSIPWSLIAPHEGQALRNHSQTLERLAQRGGLSSCEAVAVLESRPWRTMQDGKERLKHIVETDFRSAMVEQVKQVLDNAKFVYEGRAEGLDCEAYIRVQLQVAGWNL